MNIAIRLSELMEKQGLNSHSLSGKSDVPQPRIHEIVSGKTKNPQMKTLLKLATALGVSVDALSSGAVGTPTIPATSGDLPPIVQMVVDRMLKMDEEGQLDALEAVRNIRSDPDRLKTEPPPSRAVGE